MGGCCHFCYDALRKIWGGGGFKCCALRNANEKIENALIDIAIPKNEWGYRCFDVPQCLYKNLTIDKVHFDDIEHIPQVRRAYLAREIYPLIYPNIVFIIPFERLIRIPCRLFDNMV